MKTIAILNNIWVLVPLIIWTLVWKGMALWKAARRGEKIWFVALLVLNTLGVLEIIYIFLFAKKKEREMVSNQETENFTQRKIV